MRFGSLKQSYRELKVGMQHTFLTVKIINHWNSLTEYMEDFLSLENELKINYYLNSIKCLVQT